MKLFSDNHRCCSLQSLVIYLCTTAILLPTPCSYGFAYIDDNDNQRTNLCSPCSAAYLATDPNHPDFSSASRFTKPLVNLLGIDKVIKFSNLHRILEGEGSHRRLISKLKLEVESDASPTYLDGFDCELVIIESLNGVFADPFELRRLVNRKEPKNLQILKSVVYLDAAVFGDTNLELPSALSNSSFVEIHMDLVPSLKGNHELVIELPLHARYPPLDGGRNSRVEISQPDLYTRCRRKGVEQTCQCALAVVEAGLTKTVNWHIPRGDEARATFVSTVTFLSALVCALSIVSASIFYHPMISSFLLWITNLTF